MDTLIFGMYENNKKINLKKIDHLLTFYFILLFYLSGTMLKVDGTLKSQFNIDKSQIPTLNNNNSNGSGNNNNNNKPKRQSFINRAFSIKSSAPVISSPSTLSQDNNTFQAMPSAIMKEIVDDLIWDKTTRMDQVEGVLLEKFNIHLKGLGSKQIASSKEAKLLGNNNNNTYEYI